MGCNVGTSSYILNWLRIPHPSPSRLFVVVASGRTLRRDYRSRGSGAPWCPGIKKKKKTADRLVPAPFDLRADIHRPQTTPFFGLIQFPPPELSYCLLYRGSNATAHIPRKLSSFCALFGAPSLAKSPACEVQQRQSKAHACEV
jgi:hypothetical protein